MCCPSTVFAGQTNVLLQAAGGGVKSLANAAGNGLQYAQQVLFFLLLHLVYQLHNCYLTTLTEVASKPVRMVQLLPTATLLCFSTITESSRCLQMLLLAPYCAVLLAGI